MQKCLSIYSQTDPHSKCQCQNSLPDHCHVNGCRQSVKPGPPPSMLLSVPLVIISTLAVISFLGTSLILSNFSSSLSATLSGSSPDRISPYIHRTRPGSVLARYPYRHPASSPGWETNRVDTDASPTSTSLLPWLAVPSLLVASSQLDC